MNKFAVVFASIAMALSPGAFADGQPYEARSGFYLSGGLGFHSSTFEGLINDVPAASETNSGLLTSIKVGGYLNPQFALYYVRDAAWWSDADVNSTAVTGLSGIGGSYYFDSFQDSWYLEFGVGLGDLTIMSTGETTTGGAAMLGVGKEITSNFQLSGNMMSTVLNDNYYSNVTYENFAIYVKGEFKL